MLWSPQQYFNQGKDKGYSKKNLDNAIKQIENVSDDLPGILSLNHLAVRTEIPYFYLRKVVAHKDFDSYRKFSIRKRSGGQRFIHIPSPKLMYVQRWIDGHILKKIPVHPASFAFTKGSSILKCANRHSGAQWLIKMDITGFFESISEIQVFRVFRNLGYQPLVSFELARICTVPVRNFISPRWNIKTWRVNKPNKKNFSYNQKILGYLPQGAPTSPRLSNLVMKDIDEKIDKIVKKYGLKYTRYSDDLTFSTRETTFCRKKARSFIADVSKVLIDSGFMPQYRKTKVIPPGSRKIVLGLQVDGSCPKLRKEFKDNLRQHLYYLEKLGPKEHAIKRKFDSIWGMKCHIRGLIDFTNMVDRNYAGKAMEKFNSVNWPM